MDAIVNPRGTTTGASADPRASTTDATVNPGATSADATVNPGATNADAPVVDPAAGGADAVEAGGTAHASLLNKLRAAVLGANDGIVSVAGMVMGVAGATTDSLAILIAGIAGLTAGALSMAVGEYVSVSAQRDSERAVLARERWELETRPDEELLELAGLYEAKGLTPQLALEVATQLHEHDALAAHAETELGLDPNGLVSPWSAAWASMAAFTLGALVPLLAMVLTPPSIRIAATVVAVVIALVIAGFASARVGGARTVPAIIRVVSGGLLAMAITYGIGTLVGINLP